MTAPEGFQRRVYDGSRLRALHSDNGHSRLIVTFDFRMVGKKDFPPASPSPAFDKNGYDQLRIQSRANDWFINDETEAMEAVLAPLAQRYDAVRLMGYSMGGYGVFRFARTLRASHVFAVSPQISVHPDAVPFDRRYYREAPDFDPVLGDIPSRTRPEVEGFVVTDGFNHRDLGHALLLQVVFPQVRILRLGFGGHPATNVITSVKQGFPVQRIAMMEQPRAEVVHAAHRRARRSSPLYWASLARQADRQGHPALAAKARDEAARLAPPPVADPDQNGGSQSELG